MFNCILHIPNDHLFAIERSTARKPNDARTMHSVCSALAVCTARGTPHPAQILPKRRAFSSSGNPLSCGVQGWVFLWVSNNLSLVSELQLRDGLFVFSKYRGLEASSSSLHFYSAFHPVIPSNAFIFYHSNMIFPSCINTWKQMLAICINILAITYLKDDCFLILIFILIPWGLLCLFSISFRTCLVSP